MARDALQEAARLIEEFGVCYTQARRYRQIAAECEDRYLARALAIGSEIRQQVRAEDEAVDPAIEELRRLCASCAAAIAAVRASAPYRQALHAWEEGRFLDVAVVAPAIFEGIEPYRAPDSVYHAVIATLIATGIAAAEPVPDLGADAAIRAVFLEDDPDAASSPITLVVEPERIGLPTFRLGSAGEVLIYAPSVPPVARVRCAATVSDEWWAVRPDAYSRYVDDLERELAARGVRELVRGRRFSD